MTGGAVFSNYGADGGDNNLELDEGRAITILGTLDGIAQVGVTVPDLGYVFAYGGDEEIDLEACADYFVSDRSEFIRPEVTDEGLVLNGTREGERHEHCFDGSTDCDNPDCAHDWTAWMGEYSLSNGNYYLSQNHVLREPIRIHEGEVHLCLNGHKLELAIDWEDCVLWVNEGAKLILCDCNGIGGKHEVHDPTKDQKITIEGGLVTGGTGGGVWNNGVFVMFGGSIAGNHTNGGGGGVYNTGVAYDEHGHPIENAEPDENRGFFELNNGSILCNLASNGGGVFNDRGTFFMNNGEISSNQVNASEPELVEHGWHSHGGGVYNEDGGTFEMNGGVISNNQANANPPEGQEQNGGGHGGGVFNAGGQNPNGAFTMNGGTITGNSASDGGGVCNRENRQFTLSNHAEISNNTAFNEGGAVFNVGRFTMSGGSVTGNTANVGGGVWNQEWEGQGENVFDLSGFSIIQDNRSWDGTSNNLYLCGGSVVTVVEGGLAPDTRVGVMVDEYEAPFAVPGEGVESLEGFVDCFISDNGEHVKTMVLDNGSLVMREFSINAWIGEDGNVQVELSSGIPDVIIYVAGYKDGKMISCATHPADGETVRLPVSAESDTIRVFFLHGGTLAPVFQVLTVN